MSLALLRAFTGLQQGRTQRADKQYSEDQDALARSDRQSLQQQQERDRQQQRADALSQQTFNNNRLTQNDADVDEQAKRTAYNEGFDPVDDVHARGSKQVSDYLGQLDGQTMAPQGDPNAGAVLMNAPSVFKIGSTAFAKARDSEKERTAKEARQDHSADLEAQRENTKAINEATNASRERMSGDTNDTRLTIAELVKAVKGNAAGAASEQKAFTREQKLMADYKNNELVKNAYGSAKAIAQLQGALKGDTGIDDLNLIYGVVKLFDPNSAVREGEIKLARSANSLPGKLGLLVDNVNKGRLVTAQQRAEIADLLRRQVEQSKAAISPVQADYGAASRRYGADSSLVAPDPFRTEGVSLPGTKRPALSDIFTGRP